MNARVDPYAGHVTVHASAGTGKTWMLVSRLLRLLLEGARPEGILALTFTHKAAAEMQTRLLERLLALVESDDAALDAALTELNLGPDPELRRRARELYETLLFAEQPVQTTTFHAFCQQLLRRFPLEADVPPGFVLLERTGVLRNAAWEALAVEAAADREGPLATALDTLFQDLGLYNTRRALDDFVEHRADWWALAGEGEEAVERASAALAAQLAACYPDLDLDGDEDGLLHAALGDAALQQGIIELAELLGRNPNKTHLGLIDGLHAALDTTRPTATRWQALATALLTQSGQPRKLKAAKGKYSPEQGEALLAQHAQLVESYLAVQDRLLALRAWRRNRAWMRAGHALLAHFQRLKREQRLLDFTDLEWRASRLLNDGDNALWVQYKLDARIDHLLIDEFQDTNPTQWRLVLPLLEELAAGESERRRSVFLVGDAKQSIYRFRRAEPRLFEGASRWLAERLGAASFPLNRSWRSAPAIMDFVNRVFDHPVYAVWLHDFQPHATHREELPGRVVMLPLMEAGLEAGEADAPAEDENSDSLRDPLRTPRPRAGGSSRRAEAEQLAATIGELMARPLVINAGEAARPLRYGDIFILVRQRTHVAEFEDALRAAHIPYLGAERGTLLAALEIRDMVTLLQWLLTPYDNLALAAILRSPLFAVDDAQLARLAEGETGNWWTRLCRLVEDGEADALLARAAAQLAQWQALAGHIPVHDLLDRIYSEGNVLARYRAASAPHMQGRVTSNLAHFLELALDLDAGRYPSLMRFLESLREMREHPLEAPDEPPAGGDEDRVHILTVHAAKGLEAPVVFLADCATAPGGHQAHRSLVDWPVEAAQPELFMLAGRREEADALCRRQIEAREAAAAREEANLLYVAVTRARQFLYLSGTRARRGNYADSPYARISQALELGEDGPETAVTLSESGALPTVGEAAAPPPGREETIDPALCRPLADVPVMDSEIAPSHGEAGGVSPGSGDEDARLRGLLVHRLLELLSEGEDAAVARVAREQGLAADNPLLVACDAEARAVLAEPALAHLFAPGTRAWNEVPVCYEHAGRVVHGVIDRLVDDGEVLWLVDYKSHRHARADNLAALAADYREQMGWYAEGVRRLWPGRTVRPLLLFTACRATVAMDEN